MSLAGVELKGGNDEETVELRRLQDAVIQDPDNFAAWELVVGFTDKLDGRLTRNSNPDAITTFRTIYDNFLLKYPLLFGYWKRYADLEFAIGGTEAAEWIWERAVACVPVSPEVWNSYCIFKMETCHEADIIRELFERGLDICGLAFHNTSLWETYMEFEARQESHDRAFAILKRLAQVPSLYAAKYSDDLRRQAEYRPIQELVEQNVLAQLQADIAAQYPNMQNEIEMDREIRSRIDTIFTTQWKRVEAECVPRAAFEVKIRPPYFLVADLEEGQLENWQEYLEFEERKEDNYARTVLLYERCLIPAASYDEMWIRYARWMRKQAGKDHEVRGIFERASCVYAAISKPLIRFHYGLYEASQGRVDVATEIYNSILMTLPGHKETVIALANLKRRHSSVADAIQVYRGYVESAFVENGTKGDFIAEWATLLSSISRSPEDARALFQHYQTDFKDVDTFWYGYLKFEMAQPATGGDTDEAFVRAQQLFQHIRFESGCTLEALKGMSAIYLEYLLRRGTAAADKEYLDIDAETYGPASVQQHARARREDGDALTIRPTGDGEFAALAMHQAAAGAVPATFYYQQ